MSYDRDQLMIIKRFDGRDELIVSDGSLKLVLDGLDEMRLTLPIREDQWEVVEEYLKDLDAQIGGKEIDRIRPTAEYDDMVCRAVDEFLKVYHDVFIDYDALNVRLAEMMSKSGVDGKYVLDVQRWLPREPVPKESRKGRRRRY